MNILPQLVLNSIIAGAIYALVALGFNLIYGATKFFNFTHGAVAVAGTYGFLFFGKTLGLNLFLSVFIGVAVAATIGYGLDKLVYRPLRKRKASNMSLLIASLGAFTALQAIIAIIFTSQFQTLWKNYSAQKIYEIFGGVITQIQLVILASVIIITATLFFVLKKTLFGKTVRAVSDDEEAAKIIGLNTDKIISRIFIIGSAIAGLAGILVGFDTGVEPTMGMNLLLKGVVASIIGGAGSITGGFAGAFLLGFAENFGIWKISGEWKDAIVFALLIIFLLFRPQGIIRK